MPHLRQPGPQGMPAGVLAEHQIGLADAHVFGAHDLVGLVVLEHAVLVDARLVRKSVRAYDGFVRLHD